MHIYKESDQRLIKTVFLNLDNRSIPLFPDGFLEVLDDMCHDPGFCGKLRCIGFEKMGGIDDTCTGQFLNHRLVESFDGQQFLFPSFELLF